MRREVRRLKAKAIESLTLSIELFNRPHGAGRTEAVLLHADHAFEMLLKAVIRHRGGEIRKAGEAHTIGFKDCLSKCLGNADIKCLSPEQAITLQALNGWRDAAQHYLLELSEPELYVAAQGSVTLFDDILKDVFADSLRAHVPERVLPVSTSPPHDIDLLLDDEFNVISELIVPGSRRLSDAKAKLRPIAILDAATAGSDHQPTEKELEGHIAALRAGSTWRDLFPGVGGIRLDTSGTGLTYSLRFSKKEGIPIHTVKDGEAAAAVIGVKRVNELDFYQFGFRDLAERLKALVSTNKLQGRHQARGLTRRRALLQVDQGRKVDLRPLQPGRPQAPRDRAAEAGRRVDLGRGASGATRATARIAPRLRRPVRCPARS